MTFSHHLAKLRLLAKPPTKVQIIHHLLDYAVVKYSIQLSTVDIQLKLNVLCREVQCYLKLFCFRSSNSDFMAKNFQAIYKHELSLISPGIPLLVQFCNEQFRLL